MTARRRVAAVLLLASSAAASAAPWRNYGRDAQHAARSPRAAQPLQAIRWQATVDLDPQKTDGDLLVHYGSPVITAKNTVVFPVKTGATDGFRVEARAGRSGALLWTFDTDYVLPPHDWTPPCGVCLGARDTVFAPAAGGTLLVRTKPDKKDVAPTRSAFYGVAQHDAQPAAFDAAVKICTPLVSDAKGNVYFGFLADAGAPAGLLSGFARVPATGDATWTPAATASGDATMTRPAFAAAAVSLDGKTLYVVVRDGADAGYVCALDAATLARKSSVRLKDPLTPANDARVLDVSTASPTVGPDGDVYFGVIEAAGTFHAFHGWLLHYDAALATTKTPGAFGWDDTASIVPRSAVPSYRGASKYLLLVKYNDYVQTGGLGLNRLAVLDPNDTQADALGGVLVMKEVLTVLAPTPDDELRDPGHPDAVREWCINTAAVDAKGRCALVNNEDGILYRWDFRKNALTQSVVLTQGLGEAYTPTVVGPDGLVYAINDATLFAVGRKRR